MTNPTYITSGGAGVAATSFNVTLGTLSGCAVGDVVIAWGVAERNSFTPTILGGTSAWTQVTTTPNTNHTIGLYWKRLSSGDLTMSVVADTGATGRRLAGGYVVYRNSLDPVFNLKTPNTSSVTSFSANAMTPGSNDAVLLTAFTSCAPGSPFARTISGHQSGWTERVQASGTAAASSNPFLAISSKPLTGGSGISQTFDAVTVSSASEYNAFSVVLGYGIVNAAPTSTLVASKTTAIEPGEEITMTAADDDDVAVTGRTFRQVSGSPSTSFTGASTVGGDHKIIAPYTVGGTTLRYGYQVTDGALSSTEATVDLAVLEADWLMCISNSGTPVYGAVIWTMGS